jgi:hypothetical protein
LSKTFDVPYRTLISRSYRERWNVAGIKHGLPRRTKEQQSQLEQVARETHAMLPEFAREIHANFTQVLLRVSRSYKDCSIDSLKKDSRQVLQFVYAASKLLGWNDVRSPNQSPTVNLQLLAIKPEALKFANAKLIAGASEAVPIESKTESPSVDQGTTYLGTPNTSPDLPPTSDAQ